GVGVAEHFQGALVGMEDAHHHPDRGRLAGAVGAEKAVDRALGDLQREVVDGDEGAEPLGDVVQDQGVVVGHDRPGRGGWRHGGRTGEEDRPEWTRRSREAAWRRTLGGSAANLLRKSAGPAAPVVEQDSPGSTWRSLAARPTLL